MENTQTEMNGLYLSGFFVVRSVKLKVSGEDLLIPIIGMF